MAYPDLSRPPLTPEVAARYHRGDERGAALAVQRLQQGYPPDSGAWAQLERLRGLLLIAALREVEGTFALERADAQLDRLGLPLPDLSWLEDGEAQESAGADQSA